jgi:hypothetical protein
VQEGFDEEEEEEVCVEEVEVEVEVEEGVEEALVQIQSKKTG